MTLTELGDPLDVPGDGVPVPGAIEISSFALVKKICWATIEAVSLVVTHCERFHLFIKLLPVFSSFLQLSFRSILSSSILPLKGHRGQIDKR